MSTEIDSLQIKIESQSSAAIKNIDELIGSLSKLKDAPSAKKLENTLKGLGNSLESLNSKSAGIKKLDTLLSSLKVRFSGVGIVVSKAYNSVAKWVNETNSYVENVNLFTVAMGEYAEEAMEYAETVSDAMGVDVSEFIRNQGIFMSMANGFGLATDQAYKMSRGLTELSYDLASFYNISLDSVGDGAFAKVQSGIAGELEPLRRLGFALSEATLQQVAYSHGINLSVREMTEAQKATLRYTAMVEQAADMGVIGDMARTLISPANAMRIMQQQITQLTRALGSLFIPIIIKVMPYLQAFVSVITEAVQKLAQFVGFTLPTIDYSGLENVSSGVAEGLDEAADNAKKLKSQMTGIDELNVVSQDTGSTGVEANGYASDLGLNVDSIWDESMFANIETQVDSLIPKMQTLATVIGTIAVVWGGIKVGGWLASVATAFGVPTMLNNFKAFVDLLREGNGFLPTFAAAFPKVSNVLTALGGGSLGAGLGIIATVLVLIGSAIYYVVENFDAVKRIAQEFFAEEIAPKLDAIKGSFEHIGTVLQPIADFFRPIIDAVKEFFTETLGIKSLADVFEFIGGIVFHVIGSVIGGAFSAAVNIIKGFVEMFEGVVDIVAGIIGAIVNLFQGDLQGAWESVVQIGDGIVKVFVGLWDLTYGALISFVDGVIGWFVALWDELVGHSIVPDTINAIVEWFASLPGKVLDGLGQFCTDVAQKFKDLWEIIVDWFTTNISPKFTKEYWITVFNGLKDGVAASLESVKSTLSKKWSDIRTWWRTNVSPKFTKDYWADIFSGVKDGFVQGIKNALNKGIDMLNSFIGWINDKMSFTIPGLTIAGHEVFGSTPVTLFTLPTVTQRFADGGFIEDGLFTMNHGEIAGKFSNGKSVVANNEQIIAGISEGVYSAVMAAMSNANSSSGEQNINVYLDGKQIYSSVKKTESERGKQIFGNQLSYGY